MKGPLFAVLLLVASGGAHAQSYLPYTGHTPWGTRIEAATTEAPAPEELLAPSADFDGCYVSAAFNSGTSLARSKLARDFVGEINNGDTQARLRKLYKLDAATYERLSRLAVGILGAESKFGRSPKYWVKERFPWLVSAGKKFKSRGRSLASIKQVIGDVEMGIVHETLATFNDEYPREAMVPLLFGQTNNSRGPTQIKYLPEKLHRAFPEIKKEDLADGSTAAIATVAYLAEAVSRLKALMARYGCELPEDRLIEHTLYLYSGNADEIVNCTATIDDSIYYKKVMKAQPSLNFGRRGACESDQQSK